VYIALKAKQMATIEDFEKIEIRVGKIIDAQPFPEARKPAYKLLIDFGPEGGIKRSSAQITKHYKAEDLLGKLVLVVVNFPPRQIGPFTSEVLTLGVPDENGDVILVVPDKDKCLIGGKLY
jgi:tRNA-binding protein